MNPSSPLGGTVAGSYYGRLTWPRRTLPAEDLYLSGEFTVISPRLRIPIDSSIGFVRSCITGSRVAKKGKRCSHLVWRCGKGAFSQSRPPKDRTIGGLMMGSKIRSKRIEAKGAENIAFPGAAKTHRVSARRGWRPRPRGRGPPPRRATPACCAATNGRAPMRVPRGVAFATTARRTT